MRNPFVMYRERLFDEKEIDTLWKRIKINIRLMFGG